MRITRIGSIATGWGESLVWDDRAARLYFVDCADATLQWLEGGDGAHGSLAMPSMPTGVVPTEDGRLLVVLDDGLHLVDPDAGRVELVTGWPDGLGARANDACADLHGNVITGTLNLGPDEGSAWRWSPTDGWRLIDPDISNTNGPNVAVLDGDETLVVGDTSAVYWAYPYDGATGDVGERRSFGDPATGEGTGPDGATFDADGGLWCAIFGAGRLVRFAGDGTNRVVPVDAVNPTDVAFGGANLDRLFVTTIAGEGELDGALLVVDDLGARGRPEPRCAVVG